jgi:hypothetical protein
LDSYKRVSGGEKGRFPGIGDYLNPRSAKLEELLASTEKPNLQFLPFYVPTPLPAKIPHGQKVCLIFSIKR